ncbi:MAG: M20/M25/M40 family metallo-hydrolase [Candidatus Peregrinibacteria bacterium]|nr:M20/M25/M40 family metallo-hydrolase [Candidatus Peregrinibacteria bacterium]MCB9808754.1 M20/M25/M40 family metallo-hydrolase [Candidatus Peribacteria bacterium]
MPTSLPSPEKLLGEMLRYRPYTREGQWLCARRIEELVRDCGLGLAATIPYHETKELTARREGDDFPLVKITSEFGPQNGHSREMMTWLGHLDTVDPQPDERDGDAFVIEEITNQHNPETAHLVGKQIGRRRGTDDMWAGNLALLYGLESLRKSGRSNVVVQTILSSREELGSEVLHQAIEDGTVERAKVGATTEILVGDDGKPSPLYRGRTGRIGVDIVTNGEAPHAGAIDRYPEAMRRIADRHFGRLLDEILDDERGFFIPNQYPNDTQGILRTTSRLIPGMGEFSIRGLSPPDQVSKHFDIFHSDPNLDVARVQSSIRRFLQERFQNIIDEIGYNPYEVTQENRRGVPFTDPWITPEDHTLVEVASKAANEIRNENVPIVGASGVAEDGMLFHRLGTKMIGWAPDGKGAHWKEWVVLESIMERAHWLKNLAQFDGKWE